MRSARPRVCGGFGRLRLAVDRLNPDLLGPIGGFGLSEFFG